jgi:hypothetical protein
MSQPHFEANVRTKLTLPKVWTWSPPGLSKTQSSIVRVKTLHLEVFFIPLETSWSVNVENGVAWAIWTSTTQVMVERRAENQTVKNRPDLGVCRWSEAHPWKTLKENYKFALHFIPIRGLSWELWVPKVPGIQTGTILGLFLGSPRTKSHSDVGVMGKHREYYMGEGGGFPWVQAVMSQVSLCCSWLVSTPRVISNVI